MTAADYNRRIAKLRSHARWWADDAKQAEAVELAGGGCNESGVYLSPASELVAKVGGTTATAHIVQSPCGLWVGCQTFRSKSGSSSGLPSIWGEAFDSRDACRAACIARLIAAAENHGLTSCSKQTQADCQKILTKLRHLIDDRSTNKGRDMPTAKAKPKPKPARPPAPGVRAPAPPAAVARPGVLPIGDLRPSPTNPRRTFPDESLRSLADSIRSVGVRQRLLVRPVAAAGHPAPRYDDTRGAWVGIDHFEVIAGERRRRAAELAGLDRVPVDVCDLDDEQVLLVQLVENDQREDVRPSEQAAAYRRLAGAGRTAEQIAADTGKPLSFVRSLLRLGRLPAWALAAVDAGTLPRATAEKIAAVPGEESRKKVAACVMHGHLDPKSLAGDGDDIAALESLIPDVNAEPLSYRDTKDLIRHHFQIELKGCPFDRKSLDLVPEAGSCEACPKRAGNDPEATAEGTRADVCLDPDCYRNKVAAYRAKEIGKAEKRGLLPVPDDFPEMGVHPPRGWCELTTHFGQTEVGLGVVLSQSKSGKTLGDLLGDCDPTARYLAFDQWHKKRTLVKTADARKALQEAGVLKKPEPRAKEKPAAPPTNGRPAGEPTGPSDHEIGVRALVNAARALGEYGEEQFAELNDLDDACANGPVVQMLRLVAHGVAYEWLVQGGAEQLAVLRLRFPELSGSPTRQKSDGDCLNDIVKWTAAKCLALLAQLVAAVELEHGPNTDTAEEILSFAELDWPQLQDQARRELAGGEPAEVRVEKAEALVAAHVIAGGALPFNVNGDLLAGAGATRLLDVPDFPLAAVSHLETHGVRTVEDIDAKLAALRTQKTYGSATRYTVLKELSVPGDVLYKAGDAIADWETAKLTAAEPAPAAKGKPKKGAKSK